MQDTVQKYGFATGATVSLQSDLVKMIEGRGSHMLCSGRRSTGRCWHAFHAAGHTVQVVALAVAHRLAKGRQSAG